MLMLVVVPLGVAVIGTAQRSDEILAFSRSVEEYVIAGPPDWVQRLPVVGGDLAERWAAITASPGNLTEYIGASARAIALWIVGQVGTVAALVIQLLLTVLIAAILYANGETAAAGVCAFARRLAGPSGERAAILSGRAIRAVAMGIVVTALIQSLLGGLGLLVIGVPHALLLTSVMFVLGIAQIGPIPVLIGAVFWGYQSYGMFWGTVILVWALATGMIDNVLRPILIKRGANLPLLLIFVGVLGGLFAFGVIGLFVGPVVLSVAYTLLQEWVAQGEGRRSDEPGSDAARGAVP
jgi:predicted PurR-regulated permease PerM